MPALDLAGKPIAITGASSGIGAATAVACARAGMPVVLGARRTDRLEQVAQRIRDAGGRAVALRVDVTRPDDCRALVERTVAEFGSIYAVYANAGYGLELPIAEMSDAQMRDIFETNFFGTLNTVRPALEHMFNAPPPRRGHILICSSCLAKMSLPYYAAYSATKAAQSHIGRAMNLELGPRGVRVSTIHPVGTRTELFEQVKLRSNSARLVEHSPTWLMQSPETVARAIIACLRRPRPEVWTSFTTRLGMSVLTLLPRTGDAILRGMIAKRLRNHGGAVGSKQ